MTDQGFKLETAACADFVPLVGETFAVALEESAGPVTHLTLTEAAKSAHARPGGREPFSLFFEGSTEVVLDQRAYWLEHERIGRQFVFLVPVGGDADRRQYQAVFN